ncbi:hypothetical protein PPYR_04728 [Photinus pyralis]|uniref:Transposase domain-containing protein n=1 Tax=Photinus pyralis TaxID=7054 RepID=A0A1Y1LYI0_PHOPY|nr:uncharacterized protein LOC116165379 isoform X1 [Photinus pyralis]XP_031335629.1 uncharacterized protein LOC116165379 isoform X1 [Photinus pyralis]KAB0790333.1 hypothetical protein PPYR_15327 [Photinus pyralis]KAB0802542.1 hypothetical protein PPYR_04728 [Photinus pyralis]
MSRSNLQKYYMQAKRAKPNNEESHSTPLSCFHYNNEACSSSESSSMKAADVVEINSTLTLNLLQSQSVLCESENEDSEFIEDVPVELNLQPPFSEFESESSDTDNNEAEKHIKFKLANWALKYNISNVATTDLLKLLHDHINEPLPLDARTLLNTTRNVSTECVHPGEYYHFGLSAAIHNIFKCVGTHRFKNSDQISLLLNIDGLPLAKSSHSQVYPILISIFGHKCVRMVGIYHGYEKPKDANLFLKRFVQDAIEVINNGITIDNNKYLIRIKCIVCDAPAKSFIKCIKGHTGYFSCTKCQIEGQYLAKVYFPDIENLRLRTDEQFRLHDQDDEHQNGISILEEIPHLNMITSFPLDYMHLVCLGVMKKLLYLWCFGKPQTKLSAAAINGISQSLIDIRECIPEEFNRKPRSINEIKMWKATEFRQMLFYTGPLVLKKFLSTDRYLNFISLHVGMTILASEHFQHLILYALDLLKYFVKTFQTIYGIENTSHNVHNLLHLPEDVRLHGRVDNFSAFDFENFMQSILKYVRKSHKPLQQIVKRYLEKMSSVQNNKEDITTFPLAKDQLLLGIDKMEHFKSLVFQNFVLKINFPDNCCCLKNGEIINITSIIKINRCLEVVGKQYLCKNSFFDRPCESADINIFKVCDSNLGSSQHFKVSDIDYKCMKLKYEGQNVIMPFLHG